MKNPISELSDEQLDELLAYTPSFSEKNLENIKRLSLEKMKESPVKRRISMKKIAVMAVAAALFLLTSSVIFATGGGLEHFLARFNTSFGEFAIAPIYPAYAESQGIRIEAVGAQQIGNVVLVYIAMQDITGENRLTRHMLPDLEIYVDGQIMNGPRTSRRLEFNNATNTSYFETQIVGEAGMPRADTIELITKSIMCTEHEGQIRTPFRGEWSMTVNTSDLGIQPIVWTNVSVGNIHIEYMSLSPLGVQITGYHTYGTDFPRGMNSPFHDVRIELSNRLFNTRLPGGGGGIGQDSFSIFKFSESPIDMDAVTAIIFNVERIPR